jgi:integrase/recombinase XerC
MSDGCSTTHLDCESRSHGNRVLLTCACGCGQEFTRARKEVNLNGLNFLSREHHHAYRTRTYLEEMCGPYLGLVTEYLDGTARLRYRNISDVRTAICPLFLYLSEHGVASIEDVKPKTITQYLTWANEVGYRNAAHDISCLSVFFSWTITEGHRKGGNPVITKMHGHRRKHRLPRPYTPEEMDYIWSLLLQRGNARLRAVTAIGEEAGLRIGEICRLKVTDVDLVQQRLFVGLPNETSRERNALFSDKARTYIAEWLEARDPECGHSYLFHNSLGDPLKVETLHREFGRTLCTIYCGRVVNEAGLEKWSTHRLRHTMASNLVSSGAEVATVMQAGGWRNYESMTGYASVDVARARKGYDEAMQRAREQKQSPTRMTILTPEELLRRRRKIA